MTSAKQPEKPHRVVAPLAFTLLCLVAWASLLTHDVGDWPSPSQYPHNDPTANTCGPVGAVVSYGLLHYLGDGAYPLVLFASMGALLWLIHGYVVNLAQRVFGLALLVTGTAAAVHLVGSPGPNTLPMGNGGVVGTAIGSFLSSNFSGLGTGLILAWSLMIGLLFTAEGWVLRLPGLIKRVGQASGGAIAAARAAAGAADPEVAAADAGGPKINLHRPKLRGNVESDPCQAKLLTDDETPTRHRLGRRRGKGRPEKAAAKAPHPDPKTTEPRASAGADPAADTTAGSPARDGEERGAADHQDPVVKVLQVRHAPARTGPYPRKVEDWEFPPLSLLHQPEYVFGAQQEALVRAKARTLEQTLDEFRLDARVVEIDTGPVITMFELQLAPGIKVSQIATLSNDIARALRAPAVRVVAPLAGKNTIGIEVPNLDKETVRLKELMSLVGRKARDMALPLFVGKDVSGAALVADLTTMPHVLIAGTTGSGKSVCINSIITSILMTKRPDHVKLILVDPKMVELAQFKEVPHLMCPIVTDIQRAESILEWAVTKMDERYELLAEARVRNIAAYNALGRNEIYERFQPTCDDERARIPTHLPYIVIIIDELADLMMTSAKEVEHHLSRLAQKSRAVGVHIVVATQRPEVRVVTGLIKSNLPCRIAFRVASRMDSRIVLDQNGAEVLMGRGDMLFLPPGSSKLIRAQGTFMDEVELHSIIGWLRNQAEPEFHPELLRMRSRNLGSTEERDALFDDAVRIVLESRRGSVSLLQRRLGVGYARGSRLIEQMADAGIVGDYKGSQAREVTLTLEQWDELRRDIENASAQQARDANGEDYETAQGERADNKSSSPKSTPGT